MYPRININFDIYKHNLEFLSKKLDYLDELFVVTKVFSAYMPIIDKLYTWGYHNIGDSRIQNLKSIKEKYPDVNTLHLRIPMFCEVDDVVKYANTSLNSNIETIKLLDEAAKKIDVIHNIILMIDLGDLREGIFYKDDYNSIVKEILKLKNIKLTGIGTNLTCYGSVLPTTENLNVLQDIKVDIEKTFNINIPILSGGNSSSLYLALEKKMPAHINSLRIGDAFISGLEAADWTQIPGTKSDTFQLEAQIIEIYDKPSFPIGNKGVTGFGAKGKYKDVGVHTRAILALGRQDVSYSEIHCVDDNVKIIGSSSDHLILEINKDDYQIGDTILFNLDYGAIMKLFTSKYVYKNIVETR